MDASQERFVLDWMGADVAPEMVDLADLKIRLRKDLHLLGNGVIERPDLPTIFRFVPARVGRSAELSKVSIKKTRPTEFAADDGMAYPAWDAVEDADGTVWATTIVAVDGYA